jgi:hypothetical protein
MADIEARVNENSLIGFFTWCWTIVVEITDGRIASIRDGRTWMKRRAAGLGTGLTKMNGMLMNESRRNIWNVLALALQACVCI